jgi:hypothetical protein
MPIAKSNRPANGVVTFGGRAGCAKMTPHQERVVAVAAGCDPRCVRAFIAGRPVRSTTAARVERALRELGLSAQVASQPPQSAA